MTSTQRAELRSRLEEVLRAEAGAVSVHRLCPRCGSGGHGVPGVRVAAGDPPYVSMAYAAGLAAVAWSLVGPVGIGVDALGGPMPDLPTRPLDLPPGHVGTLAGTDVTWRLVRG